MSGGGRSSPASQANRLRCKLLPCKQEPAQVLPAQNLPFEHHCFRVMIAQGNRRGQTYKREGQCLLSDEAALLA